MSYFSFSQVVVIYKDSDLWKSDKLNIINIFQRSQFLTINKLRGESFYYLEDYQPTVDVTCTDELCFKDLSSGRIDCLLKLSEFVLCLISFIKGLK